MAKNSNELLTSILGVLGEIKTKLDTISGKPTEGGPGVGTIALGTYLGGRGRGRRGKTQEGSIGDLADSVGRLNKELDRVNMIKLNKLIHSISTYEKLPKESSLSKRTSNMASSAKDAGKALLYMGAAVVTFVVAFGIARNALGISPYEVLRFIALTALTLAVSMVIISAGDATGEMLSTKILKPTDKKGKLIPDKNRNKSAIENAKNMGIALMFIAGGVLAFSASMVAAGALLGVSPVVAVLMVTGMISILALSMTALSLLTAIGDKRMADVKGGKGRSKDAIDNARNMGIALMFIAGGVLAFTLSMVAASALLGMNILGIAGPLGAAVGILAIISILAISILVLSTLTARGDKSMAAVKGGKGRSKDAIDNARNMGIALMFIAGGVLAFSIAIALVPRILGIGGGKKDKEDKPWGVVGMGIGAIVLMIGAMAGIFFLIGLIKTPLEKGLMSAAVIAGGMAILALGVFIFVSVAKLITGMGGPAPIAKTKEGKDRGPVGQMLMGFVHTIGAIAPGLMVMFGIIAVSAGLMAVLGMTPVALLIGVGAAVMFGMAVALIETTKAIKAVNDTMKEVGDMKKVSENIRLMVSGVLAGVIEGVLGKGTTLSTMDISAKEVVQFRRVTRIIKMLSKVSMSLSKFAEGLKAFSTLGTVMSLDYNYDADGNVTTPKLGGKIHVTAVAKSIAVTFGMFLKSLVENTEGLTRREAGAIKKLGKALTGDKGIISGVNDFANTLKIYAEYGAKGEIWVPEQKDDTGKPTRIGEHVPITTVVGHIVNSFLEFTKQLAGSASIFENAVKTGTEMKRFSEALMGKKGIWGREKPGILGAITEFSSLLQTYAEAGADGSFPKRDPKTGEIIPGKNITSQEIATKMVSSITGFVSQLNLELGKGIELKTQAENIENKLKIFMGVINQLDKMAKSQEGIDKLANSMGLLATNIGLIVTNLGGLDVTKLQTAATIAGQHATATKGIPISPTSSTTTPAGTTPTSQADWDAFAEIVGQKIADKINISKTGTYGFHIYNWPEGTLEIKEP